MTGQDLRAAINAVSARPGSSPTSRRVGGDQRLVLSAAETRQGDRARRHRRRQGHGLAGYQRPPNAPDRSDPGRRGGGRARRQSDRRCDAGVTFDLYRAGPGAVIGVRWNRRWPRPRSRSPELRRRLQRATRLRGRPRQRRRRRRAGRGCRPVRRSYPALGDADAERHGRQRHARAGSGLLRTLRDVGSRWKRGGRLKIDDRRWTRGC